MKFVSKFRKLRVVLMPTRKIFHGGANDEAEIIPPILAEFDGGIFDTVKSFKQLHQIQLDSSHPERLESEEKLVHLLKGHPNFGKDYNEFYEQSPKERIAQKEKELEELRSQYGVGAEDLDTGSPVGSDKDNQDEGSDDDGSEKVEIPVRAELERMDYPALKKMVHTCLGVNPFGISKEQLIDMLEERHIELKK